ncbi:MAG: hypothetical protein ACHQQ3_10475 [Gemmatimonadales bacterium]
MTDATTNTATITAEPAPPKLSCRLSISPAGTLDTEPTTMPHGVRAFRLRDPSGFRFSISSTAVT